MNQYNPEKAEYVGGASAGLKACPPPSPVACTMNDLLSALTDSHLLLNDLETRLHPVLITRTSDPCGNEAYPSSGAPICDDLHVRLRSAKELGARIQIILNGLVV